MKNQTKKILFLIACTMSLFIVSYSSEDDGSGEPPVGNAPPIKLDRDAFSEDLTLTNNPDAPIDYVLNCSVQVEDKLTIEPGVG